MWGETLRSGVYTVYLVPGIDGKGWEPFGLKDKSTVTDWKSEECGEWMSRVSCKRQRG